MALLYRFLTDDDTSAFCHKVSLALSQGWQLHGGTSYAYDSTAQAMRCGQAVIKEIAGDYQPDLKLGQQ